MTCINKQQLFYKKKKLLRTSNFIKKQEKVFWGDENSTKTRARASFISFNFKAHQNFVISAGLVHSFEINDYRRQQTLINGFFEYRFRKFNYHTY